MENKEQIYNKKIKPVVEQLYDLCEAHGMPFVAVCQVSDVDFIGSCSIDEDAADQLKLIAMILERGAPKVLLGLASEQAMEGAPVKVVD